MKINVNEYVRVKLNDTGRKILNEQDDELREKFPAFKPTYPEDADGYSRWQLWDLMSRFGTHISLGKSVPFETDIIIPQESIR